MAFAVSAAEAIERTANMKKLTVGRLLTAGIAAALLISGCAAPAPEVQAPAPQDSADTSVVSFEAEDQPQDVAAAPTAPAPAASPDASAPSADPASAAVAMELYTAGPNEESSISIQYPVFSGPGMEAVNALVQKKAASLATIDPDFFPAGAALTVDYQCSVTLQNSKMISLVFFGSSYVSGGAYPTTDLFPLNIDLADMREITFSDLYAPDADFTAVFFEKAFFPSEPVTSYDEASFAEMLQMQSPEFQTIDPFSVPDGVSCFLKPDGVVISLPSVHATGSDHFEAQVKYEDIAPFYLPSVNYREA